jgi:hypothetical protein
MTRDLSELYVIILPTLRGKAGERQRDIESERFGGLEIDNEVVLGRRLDRQVARFCPFEKAIDVACRCR